MHGVAGIGKTSFAACAPGAMFLMSPGETGLETLIDSGCIGEVPHMPEVKNWNDLLGILDSLIEQEHQFKTLVLDTLNGFERLCHEYVCMREFNGEWGKKGFESYNAGYNVSLSEWKVFLSKLDTLREMKRMGIIALCHTKVKPFRNPEGADFDRYQPTLHDKTWDLTFGWADIVLFANFYTVVDSVDREGKRGKGSGGHQRMMYTSRTAAYDAKNRHSLDEEIDMGNESHEAWNNFASAMKKAKEQKGDEN